MGCFINFNSGGGGAPIAPGSGTVNTVVKFNAIAELADSRITDIATGVNIPSLLIADIPLTLQAILGQTGNMLNINSSVGIGDILSVNNVGTVSIGTAVHTTPQYKFNQFSDSFFGLTGGVGFPTIGFNELQGFRTLDNNGIFGLFHSTTGHTEGSQIKLPSTGQYKWTATADPQASPDTGIKRSDISIAQITNGSTGFGSLIVGANAIGNVPLSIQQIAGQTANSFDISSSGGSAGDIFNVDVSGNVTQAVNTAMFFGAGIFLRHNGGAGYVSVNEGIVASQLRLLASTGVYIFDTGTCLIDGDNTAGNTRLNIYDVDNGTLERVSVGSADSGGAGFKVLRIPN